MHSSSKLAISIIVAASLVSAGDICAYTSRSCIGNYGCCANIPEGVCCTYPANYGWSTRFQNMPLNGNWLGKMYGDTCRTLTGGAGSSGGSVCLSVFDSPSYLNARSANWDADTSSKRSFEPRDVSDCMEANVIGFTMKNGTEHRLRIPDGTKFVDAQKLLEEEQFEELLKFEKLDL